MLRRRENMTVEQPLNVDEFFMSRNEIANRHGSRLELQAMARVREHMVEEANNQKPSAQADNKKKEK